MNMDIPLLRDAKDLSGKRALLRLDLNVPVKEGTVLDDSRIRRSLPAIKFLQERGAQVVILSHRSEKEGSLEAVARHMSASFPTVLVKDFLTKGALDKAFRKNPGALIICENLRLFEGEEKNDPAFAEELAQLGDVYVNDAFSASHRKHASIVLLPKLLPSYAGFLFEDEVKHLSEIFNPPHPSLLILGGGKAGTKIPFIESFLPHTDTVFVAGALSHNFFKCKGYEIGESLFEEADADYCALAEDARIMLPVDVVARGGQQKFFKKPSEIEQGEMILDVGPGTIAALKEKVKEAEFIIWNGPLGDYLTEGYEKGTYALVSMLKESPAKKIVGGGDSVAIVYELGAEDSFDYISSAGGAMLEYMSRGTLPGIEALQEK